MTTEYLVTVGALAHFEAKPGNEADVERFFLEGLSIVQRQKASTFWFGFRLGSTTFGAFANEEDRQSLLSVGGPVLAERNARLFAQPPIFEKVDIFAARLPGSYGMPNVTLEVISHYLREHLTSISKAANLQDIDG